MFQMRLFENLQNRTIPAFDKSLLKWVGNKQRFAYEIISYFPENIGEYFEPFLGSGAILGTLAPKKATASDSFKPLMEIWLTLHNNPNLVKKWYEDRWNNMLEGNKVEEYERVKASYNKNPNGADLLFLSRSCYGGVVRFRKDGYMSTPCGIHKPMLPRTFAKRVDEWYQRTLGVDFFLMEYKEAMEMAKPGDLVYCDPPYSHSQAILYGAQSFSLEHLFTMIDLCKKRGVYVVLSIDGKKQSGNFICNLPIPKGLFEREIFIDCGRSMLKRFQMKDRNLADEVVHDRLLLTY